MLQSPFTSRKTDLIHKYLYSSRIRFKIFQDLLVVIQIIIQHYHKIIPSEFGI